MVTGAAGHWTKAYPYVRLHQPAAYYGVNSTVLENGQVDRSGWNKGLASLAAGQEICSYFDKVMQKLTSSRRVQYFPKHIWDGERRFRSLDSGKTYEIGTDSCVVDGTYSRTTIPSSRPPPYHVESGLDVVAPNSLPESFESGKYKNFTIVGSGKTGIDAVLWLLQNNVNRSQIEWIMPRDAYYLDRGHFQPMPEGLADRQSRAAGLRDCILFSSSVDEFYRKQVEGEHLLQLDKDVAPTMHHCASVSMTEFEALKTLGDNIIRKGRVTGITAHEVVLEKGRQPAKPNTLYIDCSASAISKRPLQNVFQDMRITLQPVRFCQQTFSAALIGHVEANYDDIEIKNKLCGPVEMPDKPSDYLKVMLQTNLNTVAWATNPKTLAWVGGSRLNIFKGVIPQPPDEQQAAAITQIIAATNEMSAKICELLLEEPDHRDAAKGILEEFSGSRERQRAAL